MDMTDREAIERLNDLAEHLQDTWNPPYIDAIDMAVAALEAQIPRVLSIAELHGFDDGAVYIEYRKKSMMQYSGWILHDHKEPDNKREDEYWETWRAWSHKPTTEQMAATPWGAP